MKKLINIFTEVILAIIFVNSEKYIICPRISNNYKLINMQGL